MSKESKGIFIGIIVFLFLPAFVFADTLGQTINFFIDSAYDSAEREEISATLQRISRDLYFYFDDMWWESLNSSEEQEVKNTLNSLSYGFSFTIYPDLTLTFGSEWKPGIDKDEKITILFHPMKEEARGYFNSGDEYPKIQNPISNEREMIYLNADYITDPLAKSYLAHEFVHLITFNQKEKIHGVTEETWLNEARAEAAITFLGYDSPYIDSNLENRVKTFLEKPSDSITDWQNEKADYGVINLFSQYLVERFGLEILVDSLHSKKVGIVSLNYALEKNNFDVDFSDIFTDWTIAVLINDCDVDENYCYLNENLKRIKVSSFLNYLPSIGKSTLSVTNVTKAWSGSWHRFVGGKDTLKLEFNGSSKVNFAVPYIIEDIEGNLSVNFLELDDNQKGTIYIPDFSSKDYSLTIIPSVQPETFDINDSGSFYSFSWLATTAESTLDEEELIEQLLAQIEYLKREIARVQAEINEILGKPVCQKFEDNLYYGMRQDAEVRCLQEFLKSQGPEIYPEGLVTGNFLNLTQSAVIRFQEKYADEILKPLDLEEGTGFFGTRTRAKANELLGY